MIGLKKMNHVSGVSRRYTDELSRPVRQKRDERVNGFFAETVVVPILKPVCLVNEEDSSHSLVYRRLGLQGCVSHII